MILALLWLATVTSLRGQSPEPLVPLVDRRLPRQYEILVRLLDEQGRIVLPGEFLSAATRYQLLARLDQLLVEQHEALAGVEAGL